MNIDTVGIYVTTWVVTGAVAATFNRTGDGSSRRLATRPGKPANSPHHASRAIMYDHWRALSRFLRESQLNPEGVLIIRIVLGMLWPLSILCWMIQFLIRGIAGIIRVASHALRQGSSSRSTLPVARAIIEKDQDP